MPPSSPAHLAPHRCLLGEPLPPLPHTAAGLRHGGAAGKRAGHGAPPDQAAGASWHPRRQHLPPLHPAVLPSHHPAHAAGRLCRTGTQQGSPGTFVFLSGFPLWPWLGSGCQQVTAPAASCWQSELCCRPWPQHGLSLLLDLGWGSQGAQGGGSSAQPLLPLCSGPAMSLRGSSSCPRRTSTGSWSEWAWGTGTGRAAASSARVLPTTAGVGERGTDHHIPPRCPTGLLLGQQQQHLILQRPRFPGAAARGEGPGGPGASAGQPVGAATGLARLRALGPPALAEPLP